MQEAGAYAKADAKADVEKVKASFGKSDVRRRWLMQRDIKAAAEKAEC
jgi:hypothetical protein